MTKLYLDDVRSPPDATWTVATTAEQARRILLAGPVECATLDHDLGPCPLCNVTEETPEGLRVVEAYPCAHLVTGYDLVRWMAQAGVWPRFKPAVHSTNSAGGAAMMRASIERHWDRAYESAKARVSQATSELREAGLALATVVSDATAARHAAILALYESSRDASILPRCQSYGGGWDDVPLTTCSAIATRNGACDPSDSYCCDAHKCRHACPELPWAAAVRAMAKPGPP